MADVGQSLHLPPETVGKIVERIVNERWGTLELVPYFAPVNAALVKHLGRRRMLEVLVKIAGMLRRSPNESLPQVLAEGLFAINLVLTPDEVARLEPDFMALA